MIDVNLKNLVGRLNDTCSEALREAAHACLSRTHYDVDIEHLFHVLLSRDETDLQPIFRQWDLSRSDVAQDVEKKNSEIKQLNSANQLLQPEAGVKHPRCARHTCWWRCLTTKISPTAPGRCQAGSRR